jgi:hypothetical protein
MIQLAVVLIGVGVLIDVTLVALGDIRHDRNRVDRRWKRG